MSNDTTFKLPNFEVLGLLGRGGMASVWKARQVSLDRYVAVKILASSFATDPEDIQRFRMEARAAARLKHPGIVQVYDANFSDGVYYYVMELVDGYTMGDLLRRKGKITVEDALTIAESVAVALDYAWSLYKMVHCDIKPDNVMVDSDGSLKVTDLGLCRSLTLLKGVQAGCTDEILGTPGYMSPEQVYGSEKLDCRSDIYELGATLYHLVTGQMLFPGKSDDDMIKCHVDSSQAPDVRKLSPQASPAFALLLEKMLAKDPQDRYLSLYEFLRDLESYDQQTPTASATRVMAAPQPAVPSIAILPFVDLSAAKDQEYFCDGLAEEIMDDLARLKGLRVASRNAAFQFKGRNADILEIGKSLNVQKVLEGSIRKGGNRIRIAVRLINTLDGFLVWADEYERELADIFAIQDDISSAVVKNLQLQFGGAFGSACGPDSARHYTENVEAYSHYLRGRFYWNKRTTDSIRSAVGHFEAAIQIDPDYALAYSGLADAHIVLGLYGRVAPAEGMPRAIEAAQRALTIDEWLPEAHISLGCARAIYQWQWREVEQAFIRGIKLKPDYAGAHHWYAINLLTPLGRFEEAVREAQRALELEPFSLAIHAAVGLVYYFSRRYEDAIKYFKQALDKDPDFPATLFFLGQVYVQMARYQEAMDFFQQAMKIDSDNTNMRATYGHAAAASGKTADARALLEELLTLSQKQYVSAYDIASIYIGLGEKETALSWLEKAADERAYLLSYLKVDPILDRLREEKRFQMVADKIMGHAAVR